MGLSSTFCFDILLPKQMQYMKGISDFLKDTEQLFSNTSHFFIYNTLRYLQLMTRRNTINLQPRIQGPSTFPNHAVYG